MENKTNLYPAAVRSYILKEWYGGYGTKTYGRFRLITFYLRHLFASFSSAYKEKYASRVAFINNKLREVICDECLYSDCYRVISGDDFIERQVCVRLSDAPKDPYKRRGPLREEERLFGECGLDAKFFILHGKKLRRCPCCGLGMRDSTNIEGCRPYYYCEYCCKAHFLEDLELEELRRGKRQNG